MTLKFILVALVALAGILLHSELPSGKGRAEGITLVAIFIIALPCAVLNLVATPSSAFNNAMFLLFPGCVILLAAERLHDLLFPPTVKRPRTAENGRGHDTGEVTLDAAPT